MTDETIFEAALAIASPAERAAYLDRACAGNAELRRNVEELLQAHAASNPLDRPVRDLDPTGVHVPQADAGTVIAGKYKLREQIGEGGMGSVWLADQTHPVKRRVALKLIKAGMDSKSVLARFEAERQALAMMDHPNIAKVLDGGVTDTNSPFFVMELVKGVPITDYCDAQKLTPRQRLELFVPVCQAIQHAHQKGVIHRDIKPSNVLIAMYDDKPVPKVIDFGVAKATGATLTEQTLDTAFGGIVGTPQYMSPEQATFNNLDIDTRSDVYSLGILLYELLAGSPPFSKQELEKKGVLEMLRVVREVDPPRPSTKLSTADALPSLSANRGTEPKKLTGLLRNELDWIVMKAMEKNRARRYETANAFAADMQRYLSGEAVLAHPPSTGYRLRKFVRLHKGQVSAASLVFLSLVAGAAAVVAVQIRANRDLAAKNTELAEEQAKVEARNKDLVEQRSRAEKASDRIRAIYDAVTSTVAAMAGAHTNAGMQLAELGKPKEAEVQYRQALSSLERLAAASPAVQVELGRCYGNYGHLVRKDGRVDESLTWYDKAIAILSPFNRAASSDVNTKRYLSDSYAGRAKAYDVLTKHADALTEWDRAIDLSPLAEQPGLRASRASSRLRAGAVAEAVAEVAELTKLEKWSAGQWYDFACVYSVASIKIPGKKKEYAERAMELLQRAVRAGYNNAAHMKKDTDLDALREREDFKKLVTDLQKEEAPPPRPGK